MNDDIGHIIVRSRITVDDHQFRPVSLGHQGHGGSRLDDEGGADNDEEIAERRAMIRLLCFSFRHRLAKGDGGGFKRSFTVVTMGDVHLFLEPFLDFIPVIPFAAIEAGDMHRCPVKLEYLFF